MKRIVELSQPHKRAQAHSQIPFLCGSTEPCYLVWGLEDQLQYGRDSPGPDDAYLAWSYQGRNYSADLMPSFRPEAPAAQAELARACDLLFAPGAPVHEEYFSSPAARPACLMGQLREVDAPQNSSLIVNGVPRVPT